MKAKKRFGQHFLCSAHYLASIADAARVARGDIVLEIGPGKGSLTREIISRGARVIAIEKDRDLIPLLTATFADAIAAGALTLIEKDVLDISDRELPDRPYKLVANIPYYITGAILRKFLTATRQPESMTLLVQKEVAERIGRSQKESLLSLSVKAFGSPSYIQTVPRGAFAPAPKVDSAILHISGISRDAFADSAEEERFFELLHIGFEGRRKQLGGAVARKLGAERAERAFASLNLKREVRGEDLPLEKWLALARNLA